MAQRNLALFGVRVVEVAEDGDLPFGDASFDLVSSRHPTRRRWDELARVLRRGGSHLCQGVGSGSSRRSVGWVSRLPSWAAHTRRWTWLTHELLTGRS